MLKRLLFLTLPSLFGCFLCGELFFRFVVPAAAMPWGYYDPSDHIARFELGQGSGVYTIGRFADQRGTWRINNMGWNSDIDYAPRSKTSKPLIAVLGDSYVEALQVNTNASLVSVLRDKVRGQYDVYGFGKSGAPLSQYLQMSRYANKQFNPAVIVINVVHNDFDESLLSVRNFPYFVGIDMKSGHPLESPLSEVAIRAKTRTKTFLASAIVRYLWLNLGLGAALTERSVIRDETKALPEQGMLNASHSEQADIRSDVYKAADYVISKFKEENPGKELVFMIDAPRKDIYEGTIGKSNVLWMNKLLKDLTERHGCRFIDLTEPFNAKYRRDHVRLSGEHDYHWNEEGHRYAAEILYRNLVAFQIAH